MITTSDNSYKDTKLVKQSLKKLNSVFQELADWINKRYEVEVLNIYYDKILVANKYRPRLEIIFEFDKDEKKFRDKNNLNYNQERQVEITMKFTEIVFSKTSKTKNKLYRFFRSNNELNYDTKDLLVVFSSFESIAKSEVNNNISQVEIDELKEKYKDYNLWEISKFFSRTTFFFYTDEQVLKYKNGNLVEKLRIDYFRLLKRYDEFNYIRLDDFGIFIDSKENFNNNYAANWYYYYL